jgi:hypothetical protein
MSQFLIEFFTHGAFPSPCGPFGKFLANFEYTHFSSHHYTHFMLARAPTQVKMLDKERGNHEFIVLLGVYKISV